MIMMYVHAACGGGDSTNGVVGLPTVRATISYPLAVTVNRITVTCQSVTPPVCAPSLESYMYM